MKNRNTEVLKENRFDLIFLSALLIAFCLPVINFAQAEVSVSQTPPPQTSMLDEPPFDVAPPPLKIISSVERKNLESETGIKKRTEISLEMMEARLMRAEQYNSSDNFKQSLDDLGGFQAIMENTFTYLEKNDRNNKADSRFKQLEMFLRRQVPRLENMRRTMPYKFGYYVLKLMKVVRDTRAKAVEPLFADPAIPKDN